MKRFFFRNRYAKQFTLFLKKKGFLDFFFFSSYWKILFFWLYI